MVSEELKPCPYCNGPAELITSCLGAWVECMKCQATSTKQDCNRAAELVVRCWNEYSTNCEYKEVVTEEVLDKIFDRIDKRLSRLREYHGLNKDILAKNKAQSDCLRELKVVLAVDFTPEPKLESEPAPSNVIYLSSRRSW